jgi:hypothetical protein
MWQGKYNATPVGKSERMGYLRGEDVTSLLNTCFAKRKARMKIPLEIYFIYSDNTFTEF